jgi:type IX secretion system PorP/SprF family membrane protein
MKKLLIPSFTFFLISASYAQDPSFSQYNLSRLYTNPAFAGSDSAINISAGGRLEWPKISGGYTTENLAIDNYFRCFHGGLGLNILHDDAMGVFKTSRVDLSYAPHFELFDHKLALQAGLQLGIFQRSIDWSKLTFGDMIDERRGFVYSGNEVPGTSKKSGIDFSAGVLLYSKQFYGGVAFHHLNEPDEGFIGTSRLPLKLTAHAGANLDLNTDKFILSPNILLMQQQDFRMFMPGINAKLGKFVLGFSYRNEDAFIINGGLAFSFFKISYSYDYTVSALTNEASGGSHEIQLVFYTRTAHPKKTLHLRMI